MRNKRKDRLGEKGKNYGFFPMEIVEYRNNKDITVLFPSTGERVRTRYEHFKKGRVPCNVIPVMKAKFMRGTIAVLAVIDVLLLGLFLSQKFNLF